LAQIWCSLVQLLPVQDHSLVQRLWLAQLWLAQLWCLGQLVVRPQFLMQRLWLVRLQASVVPRRTAQPQISMQPVVQRRL
jgi:hypothetical protein